MARHTAAGIRGLQLRCRRLRRSTSPGHGDVAVHSHHDLPAYPAGAEDIAAQALPPFRAAVEAETGAGSRQRPSATAYCTDCRPALGASWRPASAARPGFARPRCLATPSRARGPPRDRRGHAR
ncbi:hypothetical protein [Streptomyces rochei]